MAKTTKVNLKESLNKLQEITEWFKNDDLDLDEGLTKLRKGVEIIKLCKSRVQEIENEFVDIKKELESDSFISSDDEDDSDSFEMVELDLGMEEEEFEDTIGEDKSENDDEEFETDIDSLLSDLADLD